MAVFSSAMSPNPFINNLDEFWDCIITGTVCRPWVAIICNCSIQNSCCSHSCSCWCCCIIALFSSLWCFSSSSPITCLCFCVLKRSKAWPSFTNPLTNMSWRVQFGNVFNLEIPACDGILEEITSNLILLLLRVGVKGASEMSAENMALLMLRVDQVMPVVGRLWELASRTSSFWTNLKVSYIHQRVCTCTKLKSWWPWSLISTESASSAKSAQGQRWQCMG